MDSRFQSRVAPGKKTTVIFLFVFFWAGLNSGWSQPPYPQRIISMSPSITETLFALGVGNRVVGVTDFCSHPEEACRLPKIGGLLNPSIETWISLQPDLIIHQEDSHKLRANAGNLGIETLAVSMTRLDNIFESIELLGKKLHCEPAAEALTKKLRKGIEIHRKDLKTFTRKKALLLLSEGGNPEATLYAVGPATFLGELMAIAGGDNIIMDPVATYPTISKEFILRHSPEVIIEAGPDSRLSEKEKQKKLEAWEKFSTITAVKNNAIHFIGADYILIPGPRFLNILDQFAKALHPEAFEASHHER